MWNDEFVAAHQAMTGWATRPRAIAGATAKQTTRMLVRDNALVTGRIELGGDRVSLADIKVPFLSVLGTRNHIIPEPASAPAVQLVGSSDKNELRLDGGHVGLVVGRTAHKTTIPTLIEFLRQRSEPAS